MNGLDILKLNVAILGRGESDGSLSRSYTDRSKPKVRYADPAAWAVVSAVGRVGDGVENLNAADLERTGVLLVSEHGPVETMATVAATARTGYLSPLRFPAATPGSLVGLTCIVFGFRGPSLNLTMPVTKGIPIAAVVAGNWLERDVVDFVFLVTCQGGPFARCVLLARRGASLRGDYGFNPLLQQSHDLSWLLTGDDDVQSSQKEV
jgi:hypothetical protein